MNSLFFNVLPRPVLGLLIGSTLALSTLSVQAQLRCNEEERTAIEGKDALPGFGSADPRGQLLEMIDLALARSQQLGAANLLAQAARNDWEEAAAARLPVVQAQASTSGAGQQVGGVRRNQGQAQAGLNLSMPLWDAGRIAQTAAWRLQLAEAARQGLISSEQQLAAQVVSYSLDRGRLLLQAQVYRQYTKRMACLVDALESVVKADKGRASELTQAQKSQMTAELSMEQTRSDLRVVEVRLKRLVGDALPASASYASLLNQLPDLPGLQEAALQSSDVKQLEASSRAQERYASVVAAQSKPQVSLGMAANGTGTSTGTRAGEWSAGVTV
ncbi:MAG: TolC family protein, partial [Burkholderiaceae bacterium]|nr:TolC family protein [Burkholderiaceae bacterium]